MLNKNVPTTSFTHETKNVPYVKLKIYSFKVESKITSFYTDKFNFKKCLTLSWKLNEKL